MNCDATTHKWYFKVKFISPAVTPHKRKFIPPAGPVTNLGLSHKINQYSTLWCIYNARLTCWSTLRSLSPAAHELIFQPTDKTVSQNDESGFCIAKSLPYLSAFPSQIRMKYLTVRGISGSANVFNFHDLCHFSHPPFRLVRLSLNRFSNALSDLCLNVTTVSRTFVPR